MYTDLFLALVNTKNPRGHPILSALLYAFCPAAARWWLAGADPTILFDPLWLSLQDLASGGTLLSNLNRYGFGDLAEEVKKYVQEVQSYRSLHPIPAPEILPLFRGGTIPAGSRFGLQNAINQLGGDWHNFFTYIRTWAFLSQDWRLGMGISRDAEYNVCSQKVALTLSGIRLPLQFDAWLWRVQVGHVNEVKIGLLVERGVQDQLRFGLLQTCSPLGDQPWPNLPLVFALDRASGGAQHFDPRLAAKDLDGMVKHLSTLAKDGPHPPLNALREPSLCRSCGYQHLCYEKHILAPHVLAQT